MTASESISELRARVAKLEGENERQQALIRTYEDRYILPCFTWAKEMGWDLQIMVRDNPGKNCVELLVERLRAAIG